MSQDRAPLRVRYEYEQDPASRLQYAHGVWGGINALGEIELNFYTESDKLPPYSERVIAPDGSCSHETCPHDEEPVKLITRHVHTKLLLNYHTARSLLEWLEEKVDILEDEEDEAMLFDSDSDFRQ